MGREEVYRYDGDSHVIGLYDLIKYARGVILHLLSACGEHVIHRIVPDDVSHGAVYSLPDRLICVCRAEEVLVGIRDAVLHVDLDTDDVLVLGQHEAC